METIFSVTAPRNVAESNVTCTVTTNPNAGQDSLIPSSVSFTRSNSLVDAVVVHSEHARLSLTTDSLSNTVSSDEHLMRFADDLSISMKSNLVGSPLVDDEDDDVRSLLAAAAAVAAAASPSSPQMRSSSSGLNTPPHTRVCNTLDAVVSNEVKDGLHTPGGAALLVSRLSSSASAFASSDTNDDDDDPLSMLISSTVSQHHNSLSYPSLMVCAPPTTTLNNPHSHLPNIPVLSPSCTRTPVTISDPMSSNESQFHSSSRAQSTPVTLCNDTSGALKTHPISMRFSTLLSTKTAATTASFTTATNTPNTAGSATTTLPMSLGTASVSTVKPTSATVMLTDASLNTKPINFVTFSPGAKHPPVTAPQTDPRFSEFNSGNTVRSSIAHIPGIGTISVSPGSPNGAIPDIRMSANSSSVAPQTVSVSLNSQSPVSQQSEILKSTATLYTEPETTALSSDSVADCDWSRSPTIRGVVELPSPDQHPSGSAEDEFDACSPSATAENLKDLEQVISSHSASLPVADDCDEELYLLKTPSFDLVPSLKTDSSSLTGSKNTILLETESEKLTHPAVSGDSNLFGCSAPVCPESNLLTTQPALVVEAPGIESTASRPSSRHTCADHELHSSTPKVECTSEVLLLSKEDETVLAEQKHKVDEDDTDIMLPVDTVKNDPILSVSSHCSTELHANIRSVGVEPNCELAVEDVTTLAESELLNINTMSSSKLNGESSEPDAGETVISEPKYQIRQQTSPVEVYDEEEYVNAAVAAVDDVVFALAGNRKPDPSLEIDPALEGTGTDRIFTLSLAPVHHNEPPACSMQSACLVNAFSLDGINNDDGAVNGSLTDPDQINLLNMSRRAVSFPGSATITATGGGPLPSCTPHSQSRSTNATDTSGMQSDFETTPTTNPVPNSVNHIVTSVGTVNLNWDQRDSNGDYMCPVCPRVFPQKALLLKHRVMHDEPKHFCDTCGRCFVREDKLKRHVMSIHTAEKPHVCHICTKAFSRKDKLKDHLKHHDRAARNFECQQCQQPFVQKSDLNRHIRGVHQGEPGVGINMGTKRRAPGLSPTKPSKKKSKSLSAIGDSVLLKADPTLTSSKTNATNAASRTAAISVMSPRASNGKYTSTTRKKVNSSLNELPGTTALDPVTTATSTVTGSIEASIAAAAAAAASLGALPTATHIPPGNHHHHHPMFAAAAAASGFMLPTMALTQAHQQFVQQQQQQQQAAAAAAAAAAMLPGGTVGSVPTAHQSAVVLQQQQLQQQQQQFFAMTSVPQSSTAAIVSTNPQQTTPMAHSAAQTTIQMQPELKTVATPNGPMMVLTRIAAASNQTAGQTTQLATGQAMFPQMVGFQATASAQQQQQQQQLQQLQQQAAVVQHQQLLQQQQASYAAAAAAQQFQFHQHQQQATQLQQHQQQQAAALAAQQQQQAAHSFLFPSVSAAGTSPAAFFCHPQDGMTAGLFLASSADPAGFALAAQAAAAAAVQRQTAPTVQAGALSASALAAATGLQVVTGYTDAATHQAMVAQQQQQQQHQQQLLLQHHQQQQQQQQQRLAAVAAAAGAVSAATVAAPNGSGVLMTTGNTPGAVVNSPSAVLTTSTHDPLTTRQTQQSAGSVMVAAAQPDSVSASAAVNNCYQLAAALYQQHHPGLMLAAANGGVGASAGTTGSTMAAMALHHQQQQQQQQYQQQQQQQVGLMAAYHHHQQQQQQAAHQHALLQQQHAQ